MVFDTETTGTDPASGDRVVEIGAIELLNHLPTGRVFHRYLNPERAMPEEAYAVHGLSDGFLADKPLFGAVADELHAFFGDARLIAHNALFDLGFLNAEFGRTGHPRLVADRLVDTLALARRRHPGAANSLDALCARYGVDSTRRTKHGALLDSELLAEVYIELIGGRQPDLGLVLASSSPILVGQGAAAARAAGPRPQRGHVTAAELAAHAAFVESLGPSALWRDYLGTGVS